MKLTKHETETTFEPVTLTITLETKEELFSLWNRLRLTDNNLQQAMCGRYTYKPCSEEELFLLWNSVDSIVNKLNN